MVQARRELTPSLVTMYRKGMGRPAEAEKDARDEVETDRPPPPSRQPTDRPPPRARILTEPPTQKSGHTSDPPLSRRFAEEGKARHAADPIYEKLATAILDGSLAPGAALPSERELSERFGVSRLIARQAIHRLADVGLVRVRQGGPSLVIHPNEAKDLRVIDLVYRLGRGSAREIRELIERQFLHGHALLFLASKRASRERREVIAAIAEDYAARGAPADEIPAFEKRFFGALAEATDNRFYQLETGWWFSMMDARGATRPALFNETERASFYREIARRLVEDKDAARYYLDTLSPVLDMIGSLSLTF